MARERARARGRGGVEYIYIYIVLYKYTQMHRPLSFCKGLMHTDDLFSASLLSALLTADELQVTSKPSAEASSAPHCTRKIARAMESLSKINCEERDTVA